ncbi:MAG: hypothetical protein AABX11_00180 [Nanoarchaeota archaeon]
MVRKNKTIKEEQLIDWKSIGKSIGNMPWFVWALGLFVVAGVIFYFAGVLISEKMNTFEYKNLAFTKEMYGKVLMYHYFYSFVNSAGEVVRYNVYLQNDPRTNPANYEGKIELDTNKVYLSVDTTGLLGCPNSILAVGKMSEFLVSNEFKITVAAPNLDSANKNNVTVANCETNPNNVVIIMKSGNETKVTQQNRCFVIEAKDCQILESTERFIVEGLAEARARSVREGYSLDKK